MFLKRKPEEEEDDPMGEALGEALGGVLERVACVATIKSVRVGQSLHSELDTQCFTRVTQEYVRVCVHTSTSIYIVYNCT